MNASVIIDAINDEIVARGCFIVDISVSKDNDIILTVEKEEVRSYVGRKDCERACESS